MHYSVQIELRTQGAIGNFTPTWVNVAAIDHEDARAKALDYAAEHNMEPRFVGNVVTRTTWRD